MNVLADEVRLVQNPALGAVLLWRFVSGYWEGHQQRSSTPLPLCFLVLPIVLHEQTAVFVKSTHKTSGLRAFATKFGESKISKQDLLLAIHERAKAFRELTLESLQLALSAKLVHLDLNGEIFPLSRTRPQVGVPDTVKPLLKESEKLGYWFSQLTLHEIASILKVRL
ncbi:MAG: hypothetical protein E8D44_10315 [Nitrospira sp.]|jgi:hypothetical protein|nr:MAG: hypothetical protein E8D44_10315 [Nitrospira sp.]